MDIVVEINLSHFYYFINYLFIRAAEIGIDNINNSISKFMSTLSSVQKFCRFVSRTNDRS
jgi:hypothetical protein